MATIIVMLVTKDDQVIIEIWEKKEKALKHLAELSKKSIGKIPQQDQHELNEEQKQWIKRKTWRNWDK